MFKTGSLYQILSSMSMQSEEYPEGGVKPKYALITQVYMQVLMIQHTDILWGYTGVHKIK